MTTDAICVCRGVTGWQIDVVPAQYRCDLYRTAGGLFPSHWPCRLRVRRNRVESRDEAVLSYMYSCHLLRSFSVKVSPNLPLRTCLDC